MTVATRSNNGFSIRKALALLAVVALVALVMVLSVPAPAMHGLALHMTSFGSHDLALAGMAIGSVTTDTLDLLKASQSSPLKTDEEMLAKAGITQATGLVAYDLEAPAKSLFPVLTPHRNEIPRVAGRGGTATNWKAITGIDTATLSEGVSEGNRSGVVTTSTADKTAAYRGLGLEDKVSFEAEYAGQGFQDVKATAALNLLRATMIQEERVILGGNSSLALGTTPTPALSAGASGGTIGASIVVAVRCIALTFQGYRTASLASGVRVGPISRTNADGSVDSIGSGAAQKSAKATVTVSGGTTNKVSATVAAVNGAVAYAWYVGDDASPNTEKLAAITTLNSAVFTSIPGTGQLATAHPSSDQSVNTLVFDGLITQALTPASGAYVAVLATGTAGVGTQLTTDGAGGCAEITTAFQDRWDNYKLGFDQIWVSGQQLVDLTKLIIKNGGAPLVRFTQAANSDHNDVTGGARLSAILNPFTGQMVPVRVDPNMPNGMIFMEATTIPYPLSGVGNVRQIKTRKEYYQLEWPLRTRSYEYGVYADELLQHYFPPAMGIISNIAPGVA